MDTQTTTDPRAHSRRPGTERTSPLPTLLRVARALHPEDRADTIARLTSPETAPEERAEICADALDGGVRPEDLARLTGAHILDDGSLVMPRAWVSDDGYGEHRDLDGTPTDMERLEQILASMAHEWAEDGAEPSDEGSSLTWDATARGYIARPSQVQRVEGYGEHTAHPDAPDPCGTDHDDHVWRAPYSIVRGIRENPGVFGLGSGIETHRVCARCGAHCHATHDPLGGAMDTRRYVAYEDLDPDAREDTYQWALTLVEADPGHILVGELADEVDDIGEDEED